MSDSSKNLTLLKEYFSTNEEKFLEEYFTLLRFKSIGTDPAYDGETRKCAEWLAKKIEEIGFEVEMWQTAEHPTIYAKNCKAGSKQPTLLFYCHYDVQPVDPIELWDNPPFEPTWIDGTVYARGAQDNKGQCSYLYQALKAIHSLDGSFPINIIWIIEGGEESGSKGLSEIIAEKKEALKADYLAVVDVGIPAIDKPSVTLGIRGIVTMEVEVVGSNSDLHSGTHGGRAYNPLHALAEIIAGLRNKEGKVTVPGFYDEVEELSERDKEAIDFSFDEEKYYETFAIKATGGEKQYLPLERSTIRPTLEVNGLIGGYTGEGFKTVIPAAAKAKISCRLVPNQEPIAIGERVKEAIISAAPEGVEVHVTVHKGGGRAVRLDPSSAFAKAFSKAYEEVFNCRSRYTYEGGSIPIVTALAEASGAEPLLVGMALESDRIHAPNEHFGWDRFRKGFLVMARAIHLLKR